MKTILIIISIFSLTASIITEVIGHYQYEKDYSSHWELAQKASTIEKKIEGIDRFVLALEQSGLNGKYDAIFLETPNNSFNQNLFALRSLQKRLHEIKNMDVKSFEYQLAMQQITQQEQNEAYEMLEVFNGVWWKENHFLLWDWIAVVQIFASLTILFIGLAMNEFV